MSWPASGSPRERGLPVSVRAGGHSWAAWSVRDDALLIDLGAMREMAYDPATGHRHRQARGQGRRRADAVPDRARTRLHRAAIARGSGLGGFLLQGGQGWNSRKYGWACENVVAIDVVTADGELVHADETRTPTCCGPRAAPARASSASITRFHLRTFRGRRR